ncbi:MAG: ABC transporter substrate-binding protein [Actinomycetota bacterium]
MPVGIRERVAIVFMTVSVIATLGLGGAVAYTLTRPAQVAIAAIAPETSGGNSSTTVGGAAGTAGTAGSAGSSTGGTSAGALSTKTTGVNNGLITVGGIYDETGAVDATVERDTVRAYFNKVNAAGGVNGYKFRLIDCDSAFDPSRAHECAQRLISQGVLAIVGWLSPMGEDNEVQYFTQQGIPVVGGLGTPHEYTSPLSFPTTANLLTFGTATGMHAREMGVKSPGVVLLNLPFIAPVKKALLDSLKKNGITPASVDEVDATKADYTDIVIKLRQENADSVIAGLDPYSYGRFFQAMDRQDYHPKFAGLGLDKPSANQQYGQSVYGAESLTPVLEPADHQSDPSIQDYINTVRTYFPSQVGALDVYSEGDWVAAKMFVEAIRHIQGTPNRKTLVDALNSVRNFATGIEPPLSYRAGNSHDPNRCFQYIHNVNGEWKTYSGWKCF